MKWRDFGFGLAFTMALLPLAASVLWQSGLSPDLAAWFPLVFVFGLVPLIDVWAAARCRTGTRPPRLDCWNHAAIFAS